MPHSLSRTTLSRKDRDCYQFSAAKLRQFHITDKVYLHKKLFKKYVFQHLTQKTLLSLYCQVTNCTIFAYMKKNNLPFRRVKLNVLENSIHANGSLMSYTDTCGFFLCQQGEAKVSINNHVRTIKAGDVYIYLPATYIYVMETSPDLKGITYKSSVNFVLPLIAESRYTKNILSIRNNPCISLDTEHQQQIEQLIEVIEYRQQMLDHTDSEYCQKILMHAIQRLGEALIHEILFYFFSVQPTFQAKLDNKDYVMQNFIINLMEHYKDNREVAYYARLQCLTPRYFSAIIKEKSGKTPQQWIIQMVINSAKQALLYTPKSIKEIAIEFHFANQSFFGKYFKEYEGLSPKDFRAKHKPGTDEE